jgi:hypothetical protein
MIASDYHAGNPLRGKPLKTDKGLGYSSIGGPGGMEYIPGVQDQIRADFDNPIDGLFKRIINVLFPLINTVRGDFRVSGVTHVGIREMNDLH